MTTRSGPRRGRASARPPAPPPSRRPLWLALAALAGFAIGAWFWWSTHATSPASPAAAAPDPAAGLGLAEANAEAVRLVQEGHALESLPYFRRQFELLSPDVWAAHKDYASALHNAAAESDPEGPATRSSFERLHLIEASLHQLDVAASLTDVPAERAALLSDRAHTLWFWGMPWDAVETLDRAAALPGAPAEIARRARLMRAVMERPDAPGRADVLEQGGRG